jgi:hypothetical protein
MPVTGCGGLWDVEDPTASFCISHQNPVCIPLRPHASYMPYPSHSSWFDHSDYTFEHSLRTCANRCHWNQSALSGTAHLLVPAASPAATLRLSSMEDVQGEALQHGIHCCGRLWQNGNSNELLQRWRAFNKRTTDGKVSPAVTDYVQNWLLGDSSAPTVLIKIFQNIQTRDVKTL